MGKSFDELTITDNYIFCNVMQHEGVCKKLLTILLNKQIGTITKLIHEKEINNYIGAKSIRFDIMVQDESGCLYDVEMQVTSQGIDFRVNSLAYEFRQSRNIAAAWNHGHPCPY